MSSEDEDADIRQARRSIEQALRGGPVDVSALLEPTATDGSVPDAADRSRGLRELIASGRVTTTWDGQAAVVACHPAVDDQEVRA